MCPTGYNGRELNRGSGQNYRKAEGDFVRFNVGLAGGMSPLRAPRIVDESERLVEIG